MADYLDIWELGSRFEVPDDIEVISEAVPEPRFIEVGPDWEAACGDHWAGIREPVAAALLADCMATKAYGKTRPVSSWDGIVNEEEGFSIDPESLAMFFMFEARELVERFRDRQADTRGYSYRFYLQYGLIKVSARQVLSHDKALRRTAFKRMAGLAGPEVDIPALIETAKPWDAVPASVQKAFLSESKLERLCEQKESMRRADLQASLF